MPGKKGKKDNRLPGAGSENLFFDAGERSVAWGERMNRAIDVRGLKKSYEKNQVLNGLSFYIEEGETFALLGVNGAGKTTALECIEGLRSYDGGSIDVKGKMGIQLQSSSLPSHIKPMEAVGLFSTWSRSKLDPATLDALGIQNMEKKQYGQLSTGQKRRLHLALAMIGDPDILFLDEPTAGHVGQPFRRDDNRDSIKIGEKADKNTKNRVSTTLTRFYFYASFFFCNHPKNL